MSPATGARYEIAIRSAVGSWVVADYAATLSEALEAVRVALECNESVQVEVIPWPTATAATRKSA